MLAGSNATPKASAADADRARQQLEDVKTAMSALQEHAVHLDRRSDELARVRAALRA